MDGTGKETRGEGGSESGRNVGYCKNGDDLMGNYMSKLTQMFTYLMCSIYFVNYSSIKPVQEILIALSGQ